MSDFFEGGESENIHTSGNRPLRQRNAIIGILVAIVAVLVAILLVRGCDDNDNVSSIPVAVVETETPSEPSSEDTPPEAATEEAEETPEEEEVVEPTPLPDDPESLILLAGYKWMDPDTSEATIALQELLEIEADGWYGMGTREAHLAALEERSLPSDYAATCDITVGEELCGLSVDTPLEEALATLVSGLGPTDNETEWYQACYSNYKDVYWGPVYARFNKIDPDPDGQDEGTPAHFEGWGIENRYYPDSQEWEKTFPADVTFTESNLYDWNGDRSATPVLTETVIPAGSYLTHSADEFQGAIGHALVEVDYFGYFILITDQYRVQLVDFSETLKWEWMTDTSELACD